MRTVTAKCECRCDSLTFSSHIYPRQLLFVELIERQLDRADGVEQIAVALQASLGGDGRVLCTDEPPLLQQQVVAGGFLLFTATQFLRTPILLFLLPVGAVRFDDERPALPEMGRWCRADCRCA